MDQQFEGTPKAEIRVEGRTLIRGDVTNDWGSQLVWEIRRNGQPLPPVAARADASYTLPEPGQYEVVLQIFRYDGYEKDKDGKYTKSKFVDASNKLTFDIA